MKLTNRLATASVLVAASAIGIGCSQQSSQMLPNSAFSTGSIPTPAASRRAPLVYSNGKYVVIGKQRVILPNAATFAGIVAELPGVPGSSRFTGFTSWTGVNSFSFTLDPTGGASLTFAKPADQGDSAMIPSVYSGSALKGSDPAGQPNDTKLDVLVSISGTFQPFMTIELGTAGSSGTIPTYLTSYRGDFNSTSLNSTYNATSVAYTYCVSSFAQNGTLNTPVCQSVAPTPTPGPAFSEFALPSSATGAQGIAKGYDGALWFTETAGNNIGRIASDGTISEYPLSRAYSSPSGIAQGPAVAHDEWFTEQGAGGIGRISTAGIVTSQYFLPAYVGAPNAIATAGGNVYFTDPAHNAIGFVTTAGHMNEHAVPTGSSGLSGITRGSDGNVWFTENAVGKIGTLTLQGLYTEYPLPSSTAGPLGIVNGPDGTLWFAENSAAKIGSITTAGTLVNEWALPNGSTASSIAPGGDGALWFTDPTGNNIGRITTAGVITLFPIPTGSSAPSGIVAGPNHAMWFVETNGNKIGEYGPIF